MAPQRNNDRHSKHTGTIPKSKVRNNCNVPQEAVTPTRRDMTSNIGSTSLDWVPVSEYNTRSNFNQSRKPANNTSDHELTDLDNSVTFESGLGRFVSVRPQRRIEPIHRENLVDHHDDGHLASGSGYSLNPYAHSMQNGYVAHSNHAAAAVMIVNPTTPNATGNITQPFNAPGNQNRNNLTRNLNSARNNLESNSGSAVVTPPLPNSRAGTKTVNLMNNMYESGQGSSSNLNDNSLHRESARALGEAIVAACPDAAAVERRLGQIREYIRVTSSLVDTMRNSEDEDVVVRPMSEQSNGSAFSENELWQSEIKNKMEMSQQRLTALKQQQRRLLKYQAETKQQLEEMSRARSQEMHPSTSHDNLIGVATTLPHISETHMGGGSLNHIDESHPDDDRYSHRGHTSREEEAAAGGHDSDEEDEVILSEQRRQLTQKLRELQMKKQHMENMVSEFHKLQMAARMDTSHNTYSSSGEESIDDEPARKCSNQSGNIKNEDPFKLMEIKAIKAALEKTKDLMRSVENYEAVHLAGNSEDPYQMPQHSNIHDNKSEGGASTGGWSNEGSMCRVRNPLQQRHKFTNEQHSQQQSHEANIASLQELAQELRMETEKIMGERARLKDMASNKEFSRKQKKVNEEVRPSTSAGPGPAERRQIQLRALLAEKQKELEALLKKEKVICVESGAQAVKPDSRTASIANQSYNSELEEPDSRSEQILVDSQNSRDNDNFRGGGDSGLGVRSINTLPSHMGSAYASDSDSASRTKSNQRNRGRRRQTVERQVDDNNSPQMSGMNQNIRHEPRMDPTNVNMVPPVAQGVDNMAYPHMPPPSWNNKSNQDMRANQFTQNSHSQTMDRLMGTPPMAYPPSMPFNMMMPYGGMVGGCGCGCSMWGAWCWQQIVMQQREIHQLREQLNHLEERWRAETVSHTLNNQVPPGNRANNYWDNFRSYSRQNLLSASSKTNADGHLGIGPTHNPHPLVERSHNALHPSTSSTPPSNTPKRNINTSSQSTHNIPHPVVNNTEESSNRQMRRNVAYERSLSFSSAPDVLNVNQNIEEHPIATTTRNTEEDRQPTVNVNKNRQESPAISFRNLNISNPIPEIIQSHANNINTSSNSNSKRKSSSKLPAKNSGSRRNYSLDYPQANNIHIASSSEAVNLNLATADVNGKATSRIFDVLRENVYSEVTTLIGVNESHPDFLIQLFRELQLISSDPLRQRVLQSIRGVLSQCPTISENQGNENVLRDEDLSESASARANEVAASSSTADVSTSHENVTSTSGRSVDNSVVRFLLLKSDEFCTLEFLEMLATLVVNVYSDNRPNLTKNLLLDIFSKYEGSRVCDVSGDILENLAHIISGQHEIDESHHQGESMLQDVAGSLNMFSSSDSQLHQVNCPYDIWQRHVLVEPSMDGDNSHMQDGKVDLIAEMLNGDLAEADQSCRTETREEGAGRGDLSEDMPAIEVLPDVVDTDEATPTEAEAEWLGLDRVPTRLHMDESSSRMRLL